MEANMPSSPNPITHHQPLTNINRIFKPCLKEKYIHSESEENHFNTYNSNWVYLVQNPPRDRAVPGPGAYTVRAEPGINSSKYSIRPKTSSNGMLSPSYKYPGPGTYRNFESITPLGTQFLSKWKSSTAKVFNPPHSVRFQDLSTHIISKRNKK